MAGTTQGWAQGRARSLQWAVLAGLVLASTACASPHAVRNAGAEFVLMRHAEKRDDATRDPALSPAGEARAQRIAAQLAGEPLVAVYATGFQRTQATASPSAAAHGLRVETYDAGEDAAALASRLRSAHATGTVLVVGHSNTVPALASALCACTAPALQEGDYGRVYRIRVPAAGAPRMELATW